MSATPPLSARFRDWLAGVPAAGGPDPAFAEWASGLPGPAPEASDAPDPLPSPALPPAPAGGEAVPGPDAVHYGLVECPDGQPPVVKLFPSVRRLAGHLAALEGQDVYVALFVGRPLSLTRAPGRWLVFPDGSGLRLPRGPSDVPEMEPELPEGLELQDDGFLGPPELLAGAGGV
jgi:hypothetical protein